MTTIVVIAMAWLDIPVAAWVHAHGLPESVKSLLRVVRLPGDYAFTAIVAAVLFLRFRQHRRVALRLLVCGAIAAAITAVFKWCLGRERPFRGRAAFDWKPFGPLDTLHTRDLSFPSGDATLAFATAAVIAAAFPRYRRFAFTWAIAVAATRVLQGAHYPSDVLAGAGVGLATAAIVLRLRPAPVLPPPLLVAHDAVV